MRMSLATELVDPLEFFNQLDARKQAKKEGKTYPGSTPPRNVPAGLDTGPDSWLNRLPSHELLLDGNPVKFYPIGALSLALGKTPVTIRSWEHKGWLPKARYRTPPPRATQIPGKASKGKRLYSREQLMFIVESYERFIVVPKNPNWEGFRNHIRNNYPKT
jgi:hypothetical protein